MKKTLALAALGLLCVGSHAFALSVQETKNYTSLTKDGTTTVNGETVTWSGNTITGLDSRDMQITLNHTWNLGTGNENLIYVTNSKDKSWGLYALGDGKITGKDTTNTYGAVVEKSTITALSGYPTGGVGLTLWANIGNNGVYLKSKDQQTTLYSNDKLKYTGSDITITSLTVSDYITGVAAYSGYNDYVFKNSDETWTKESTALNTYKVTSGQITFDGNGSDTAPLMGSVAVDATKDIVVGGKGSLFLQEWNKNNIYLENDIYLASREDNEAAIDFGSDSATNTTTLAGNIYLVEDAHIKSRGADTINITGTVTDKNVSGSTKTNGGYKLLVAGEGYNFKGDVNVTTLEFAATQGIHIYTRSTKATFEKGFLVDNLIMNEGNEISSAVTLTSIKTLTVNGAAKLSSVLDLSSATTLTLNHALDLDNHKLTLGALTLSGSLIADLDATLENTGFVTLFTGVSELLVGNVATASTEFTPIAAETVFTNLSEGAYLLNLENGAVKLTAAPAIPEPTTATLSLLALAGLAARRRRK